MSFSDNFIKKPVLTTVCSILIMLVVATVLSLGVVPPVYVLVKNLENRLFKY